MAVPGWPAFACWTASIARVGMVSIESCSVSVFATELLVETLLSFPRRTICLCPLLPGFEHVSEGRRRRLPPEASEHGDGGAPERRLLDGRRDDGAAQR